MEQRNGRADVLYLYECAFKKVRLKGPSLVKSVPPDPLPETSIMRRYLHFLIWNADAGES